MQQALNWAPPSDAATAAAPQSEFFARRPFDPLRLFCLLNSPWPPGVRARGCFWIATRPEYMGEFECIDGDVRCRAACVWWASIPQSAWPSLPVSLRLEAVRGHPIFGDRHQKISIFGTEGEAETARELLERCLIGDTDDVDSWDPEWANLPDPFPSWSTCQQEEGRRDEF